MHPLLRWFWVRASCRDGAPSRIAILLDSGVGDTIMALPMIRALRQSFPRASIVAVVNRGTRQVIARNTDLDGIIVFRDSGESARLHWKALRAVRRFRPDVVVVPQTGNILVQILAAYYPGAPMRIKHRFDYPPERKYSDYEFLFTHRPEITPGDHRIFDNLLLLVPLGVDIKKVDPRLSLPVSNWEEENAVRLLEGKGWKPGMATVVMHPGVGTATLNKQWPAERFAEVGKRLISSQDAQIVLVGGRAEVDLCNQIAAQIGRSCFVVAGQCSLAETAAVIRRADCFLSNDSGLMHVAVAVGARGLALYGKTNPVKIGPFQSRIAVLQAPDMEALAVDEVFRKCEEWLRAPVTAKTS